MKKQMEYANRRGIPYVVIIGSNELERGVVTLKNMQSGEQQELSFDELIATL
jgi:histidyl-tRNA synthetase